MKLMNVTKVDELKKQVNSIAKKLHSGGDVIVKLEDDNLLEFMSMVDTLEKLLENYKKVIRAEILNRLRVKGELTPKGKKLKLKEGGFSATGLEKPVVYDLKGIAKSGDPKIDPFLTKSLSLGKEFIELLVPYLKTLTDQPELIECLIHAIEEEEYNLDKVVLATLIENKILSEKFLEPFTSLGEPRETMRVNKSAEWKAIQKDWVDKFSKLGLSSDE